MLTTLLGQNVFLEHKHLFAQWDSFIHMMPIFISGHAQGGGVPAEVVARVLHEPQSGMRNHHRGSLGERKAKLNRSTT